MSGKKIHYKVKGKHKAGRERLMEFDPRKAKRAFRKAGFRVNPSKRIKRKNPKLRIPSARKAVKRSQNVRAFVENVVAGIKGHVCVQEQRGADWFTVMQSKDTPSFRELAKRYAQTLKHKQPKKNFRVVSY